MKNLNKCILALSLCSIATLSVAQENVEKLEKDIELNVLKVNAENDLRADKNVSREIAEVTRQTDLIRAQLEYAKIKAELNVYQPVLDGSSLNLEQDTQINVDLQSDQQSVINDVEQSAATESQSQGDQVDEDESVQVEVSTEESEVQLMPPPSLMIIYGSRSRGYWAQVRMMNGYVRAIHKGESIDGGFKVKKITRDSVVLEREGVDYTLTSYAPISNY